MKRANIEMNNKRLIVVLGMHRSGTSVITRGLQVLGVGLGNKLMPPVEGINAKGFFEDIDINALNVEMLQALGSDWHYLSPIEDSDIEVLRKKGYFFRAVELLRQKVSDVSTFGFKDPRVAKLLPFWKEVFANCQFDVGYVLTLRHPLSVVKSLAKRDGFDSEKSYMLWLEHVLTSLSNTEGHKRVLVDYDRLMHAPERELERMAEGLALEIDPKELQSYKSEFLDEGLRHTVYDLSDLLVDDTCPPLVREIYTVLLDVAGDKRRIDDAVLQNHIALWNNEFERIKSTLHLVDKLSRQIVSLNQIMAERNEQIASLNQAVAERDGQIASLNQAVAERDGQIANLNQTLAKRDGQIAAILASRSWRITKPLRFLSRVMRGKWATLASGLRSYIKRWVRTLYMRMPLSSATKNGVKEFAYKKAGWLFEGNMQYEMWKRANAAGAIHSSPLTSDLKNAFQALFGTQPIHFQFVSEPEVSVIIPAYRGLSDLQNCLRSLTAFHGNEPTFEIIIVDDCPMEPVLQAIPNSGGLVKLANDENLGFLLSCNRGAGVARGRYLCFLNSDTIVLPGWLRSLVEAFEETPGAAIVGGMILNQDGSIQDAGWRIMQNGWGHPIGRGGDPRNGAYTYRRSVDCVTGACFLVSKRIFQELGGFDPIYAPAFYEEFDFAFRARARGLKVIYEPRSRIVHLGSVSYGTERRDQLSSRNHAKFVERFADTLRKQPWDTRDEFMLRQGYDKGPVILVVDQSVPHPDRHAGDVTMCRYLKLFAEAGWHVVFGPFDGQVDDPAAEALERQGIELIRNPWTIEGWLAENGRHVDYVWLSRPDIAERLIGTVKSHTSARIVYYTHDLHHLRLEREAKHHGSNPALQVEAKRVLKQEVFVFKQVDQIISPSESESEVIRHLVPGKPVDTIPPYFYEHNEITVRDIDHFTRCSDVVFIGGFPHTPNVDAALFIAGEVMPLVWRDCPYARLVIVGYAPPPEVCALAGSRVVVTGQVPDVGPFLDRARVFLAPLRFGAGVKGKIIQALQYGVPVVTTPIGVEGTGIKPGHEALVAEGARPLAEAVISLFSSPERCASLSFAGADLIRKRFSRSATRHTIEKVFSVTRCGICGSTKLIQPPSEGNFREAFVCANCFALGRSEALARIILKRFATGGEVSLAELMRRRSSVHIHEFGFVGGIANTLRGWENYSVSEYFDGVPLGVVGPHGVRCEDLNHLTLPDASFDLVISQDVLEHVPDPMHAFANIFRILKQGGVHIFTVPQDRNLSRSVTRARIGPNGVEHLLPSIYHGDPVRPEGALVFTDFGLDLAEIVEAVGFRLFEHEVNVLGGDPSQTIRVFEAVKTTDNAVVNKNRRILHDCSRTRTPSTRSCWWRN